MQPIEEKLGREIVKKIFGPYNSLDYINELTMYGHLPLHRAIELKCDANVIQVLLDFKADIHVKDDFGYTALHRALFCRSDPSIIKLLLKNNARLTETTTNGHTPLHTALYVKAGDEAIKLLLEANADIHIEDVEGLSPLASCLEKNSKTRPVFLLNHCQVKYLHTIGLDGSSVIHAVLNAY
mmetsp:Transcript_12622/g.18927  ORF Transcript_12622/g.18927 Transcript_12622/m.18927 type:complete len:182 (-) Transcript_12622:40-585(-)